MVVVVGVGAGVIRRGTIEGGSTRSCTMKLYRKLCAFSGGQGEAMFRVGRKHCAYLGCREEEGRMNRS